MSREEKIRKKLDKIIDKARKAARKAEKAAKRAEKALRKVKDAGYSIRNDAAELDKRNRKLKRRMKSYIKEQSEKAVRKNRIQKKIRKQKG